MCGYGHEPRIPRLVKVLKTTGPRDSPHRRGSGSGTGPGDSALQISMHVEIVSLKLIFYLKLNIIFGELHFKHH